MHSISSVHHLQQAAMEKFCLKWNDFQTNVTSMFSRLRREEDFFDVTLVSDDQQHISAHKLVLSASSQLFKNILRKTSHSNPLIYLNGFSSKELNFVMDYIYQGEVKLFQDDLDDFLNVAQKLQIEGLIGGDSPSGGSTKNEHMTLNDEVGNYYEEEIIKDDAVLDKMQPKVGTQDKKQVKTTSLAVQSSSEFVSSRSSLITTDIKAAVDSLFVKDGENYRCTACGRSSSSNSNMRKHVEVHIEGLTFDCQLCGESFRSRKVVDNHKRRYHKN